MAETNETTTATHEWVHVRKEDILSCVTLDGEPPLAIWCYLTEEDARKWAAKLRYAIHNIVAYAVHDATAALRERLAAGRLGEVIASARNERDARLGPVPPAAPPSATGGA
jgi:hypothetical protein